MKFALKVAVILVVVLSLSVLVMAQKADAAKGKTLFASKCAMCHGANGEGKPALKTTSLAAKEIQAKADKDLEKDILEGKGTMKPVKVSAAEAADLVAHLRTLK
jgi:cytochrome c6